MSAGVLFAALAAAGWGSYILLTQHVGDRVAGLKGLAITIPVAALVATPFGLPQAVGEITWTVLAWGLGLAVLMPVLPFAAEMIGAAPAHRDGLRDPDGPRAGHRGRRSAPCCCTSSRAGPSSWRIALVVTAGIGAERRGRRPSPPPLVAVVRGNPDRGLGGFHAGMITTRVGSGGWSGRGG